jgi:hypothetical protein
MIRFTDAMINDENEAKMKKLIKVFFWIYLSVAIRAT